MKYLISAIKILFIFITACLFGLSLFHHCEINIFSYMQTKSIAGHRMILYLAMALVLASVLLLILKFSDKVLRRSDNPKKTAWIIMGIIISIATATSLAWIFFCDSYPRFDQDIAYLEAKRLAGYLNEPYDTDYFTTISRNHGVVYLMAILMKLFGPSLMSWRFANVIGYTFLLIGLAKIAGKLTGGQPAEGQHTENYIISIIAVLLSALFIPLIIYTSYHYGTLLAVTFVVWGFYETINFRKTRNIKYAILAGAFLTFGVLMHQSAAIGLIAAIIYILIGFKKDIWKRLLLGMVLMLVIFGISSKIADKSYLWITGAKEQDSLPALATMYMGITSENPDGGPGAIDSTQYDIFRKNDNDGKATNKEAARLIAKTMGEYFTGKRSMNFFVQKMQFQWLDPTMGAQKNIYLNDVNEGYPESSESYQRFYYGSLRNVVFKLLIVLMIIVYFFAAVSGVYSLIDKDASDIHFLIGIFFIGGFVFQLFWESLSRYCLSYYTLLLVEAGFGIYYVYRKMVCFMKHDESSY